MASKIRVLDEKTINQIAAGEVIESPASVVKELVDNSIDAGATKIVIQAQNSGRQLISVQDNGQGMGHDDALLCIERHATSKIRTLDDLWSLATMGFRGEALSSIASVSDFKLLTAEHVPGVEQPEGSLLQLSGGKIQLHKQLKCLAGTTIEVKSLFHNVPARRKFLKSPAKDASDIVKVVLQSALAHPEIAFELVLNHQREFFWQAATEQERIKDALGSDFFSELVPVEGSFEELFIHGFVAKPTFSRPTRSHQYLFVNRRPVVSLAVAQAVKEAYGSSLDPSRHPAFVLFVDIPPDAVDVNVHPQKREVRFSLEDRVKSGIVQAVSSALFSRHTQVEKPIERLAPAFLPMQEYIQQTPQKAYEPFIPTVVQNVSVFAVCQDYIFAAIDWPQQLEVPQELLQEGVLVVSAKRALARLVYDEAAKRKSSVQNLLVPVFIELSSDEAARLRILLPKLEDAGIHLSDFGKTSFLVQAIPSYLEASMVEDIVRSVLDEEVEDISRMLAKACKTQKRTHALTKDAAEHIIKKLIACDAPFICPAGDKIVTVVTPQELEKKFR